MFTSRKLYDLIWPLLAEQLLTVLVGMIDVLMVAQLGEAAVSGVSLADSVNHLVIMALTALTAGGTVVTAKAIGAGDRERSSACSAQLLSSAFVLMTVISAVLIIMRVPLLRAAFGAAEESVVDNAGRYMIYTTLSFPFLALYQGASAVFRAKGNTRLSMRVALEMNLFNISGNALCIFVLHMGVEGVAVPTLVSRAAAAAVMISCLQRDDDVAVRSTACLRPDREILGEMLSIGVPGSIESALFNLGKVMLQSLVSTLGTASIAAYAVASNLATYLYLPGNALGAAMTTVVGQCRGAGEYGQARYYVRKIIGINYMMLFVICTVMALFRGPIVSLYSLGGDASAQAMALILSHCIAMIIWPVAFMLPYYFRAMGRAAYTMTVSLAAMGLFRIALACLFVAYLGKGVLWVWLAMYTDWLFRSAVFIHGFRKDEKEGPLKAV